VILPDCKEKRALALAYTRLLSAYSKEVTDRASMLQAGAKGDMLTNVRQRAVEARKKCDEAYKLYLDHVVEHRCGPAIPREPVDR